MQIFHALGAIVGGLGSGVTGPLEDSLRGEIDRGGEEIGEQLGLVKSALALPGRMKRHRNDEIEVAAAEARIVGRFAKPGGDGMAEGAVARVLALMNETAHQTAAPVCRHRAVQVENAMFAGC